MLCSLDINECAGDHGCHHLCNNTDGSFHCYCDPGFMLDSDRITCEGNHTLHQRSKIVMKLYFVDINECLVDNGGCEFSCTNLVGIGGLPDISGSGSITNSESITNETNLGYQCGCDTGYQLAPNNHNCNGNYTVCMYAYHLSQHGI